MESQQDQLPITLIIDIGGSGIKARCYRAPDEPVSDRLRVPTPRPAEIYAIVRTIFGIAESLTPFDRVSIGFPGVVSGGLVRTAPNLDGDWYGYQLEVRVQRELQVPVRLINDADMHGFGVITGRGTEMVVTLGTGMGAAIFRDGRLCPNLELGHHPFEKGRTYEERLGQAALDKVGKRVWSMRADRAFELMCATFSYDMLYVGGGNAKKLCLDLPPDITIISNSVAFAGGVKVWDAPAH